MSIDVSQLYQWVDPFDLSTRVPRGRFQSFHFPTWLMVGELSDWFEDFMVIDTYQTVQLPLFLIE